MAEYILKHIVLSPQELTALNKIIKMSYEGFKAINYPLYYDCFLMNIYHLTQLGCAAVTSAAPSVSLNKFSEELDKLAGFMREIGTISYYRKVK